MFFFSINNVSFMEHHFLPYLRIFLALMSSYRFRGVMAWKLQGRDRSSGRAIGIRLN